MLSKRQEYNANRQHWLHQQVWPYLALHDAQSHTRSAAADGQAQSRQYAAAGMLGNKRADLVTNDSLV